MKNITALEQTEISNPQKWHGENTVWVLGLFGTAIGAGVLFLPINAGIGGFWPLLIVFALAFPITYLAHRGLARFICSSSTPESTIADLIGEHFGTLAGMTFTVIYFFAIYTILIMYAVAITNTAQSFITHQLGMAEPPSSPLLPSQNPFSAITSALMNPYAT